eukprot:CAMPEP_0175709894 /NCGR_PEP_ID=MMETSP0097-20121207/39806_1 /TAXON_ID=311494 /ORGANISM="Alexandrium monilatum, Strain CCMP3105" /LENGTH=31 /DNA_ID= /DNA_START= /DNA_END= /DNA_ORIENTATION=
MPAPPRAQDDDDHPCSSGSRTRGEGLGAPSG